MYKYFYELKRYGSDQYPPPQKILMKCKFTFFFGYDKTFIIFFIINFKNCRCIYCSVLWIQKKLGTTRGKMGTVEICQLYS